MYVYRRCVFECKCVCVLFVLRQCVCECVCARVEKIDATDLITYMYVCVCVCASNEPFFQRASSRTLERP
jgi:hypothetical protein